MPLASNDGGAWSLLGYMYQLVGSAALRVTLETGGIEAGDASASLLIEELGQDALAVAGQEVRLIQFKHSSSARPIPPGELAEVLTKLIESEATLPNAPPTRWILKTNRPLSDISQRLLAGTLRRGKGRISRQTLSTIKALGRKLTVEPHTLQDFENTLTERARRFGVDDSTRVTDSVVALLQRIVQNLRGNASSA